MRRRRSLWLMGCGLALVHAALWLACGITEGERAMTGSCPDGETCSAATPDGLWFEGATLSDEVLAETVHPTVVGGTHSVFVSAAFWGAESVAPFDAESSDPSVLRVDEVVGTTVRTRALSPGGAYLRIVGEEDRRLYDRIMISSAEVARLELRTPVPRLGSPLWDGPWAFRRGGSAGIVFALYDEGGRRLVDDSAQPAAASGVEPTAWDAAHVNLDGDGDELTLAIELGSGRRTASAPLVDAIDRIERASYYAEELVRAPHARVGRSERYCFLALAGDHAVAGVTFELAGEGPIAVNVLAGEPGDSYACALVMATGIGEATLIVRADAVEQRVPLRIYE